MLRHLSCRRKKVSSPRAERAKTLVRSCPLECRKTPFWNVGQTLHSSKFIPKVVYYIVLYSMGLYPPLANRKCENCQHIKKGTMYWGGKHCFFAVTEGQVKELGGKLPPSLYKRPCYAVYAWKKLMHECRFAHAPLVHTSNCS